MFGQSLRLRPITDSDLPFLVEVYVSTRMDELAVTGWSRTEKRLFLEAQFAAQHTHYQKYYPNAFFDVIEQNGNPIGRLYVDHWTREIRIVDIALLPPYRRSGIGTHLITNIQMQAMETGKSLSIHVEKNNPAYHLYTRLGFVKSGETGVYDLLVWVPTQ